MPAPSKKFTGADWGLIVTLSILWGGAFYFIVIILREVPPYTMVLLRLALAVPPLLLWLKFRGATLRLTTRTCIQFLVLGALNIAIPFILFAWAQMRISSGLASVLNATTPLWGVVVAHFLTQDEKATPNRIAGVLLGFMGVAVMMGSGLDMRGGEALLAQIACVGATLFYALASIYARRMNESGLSAMQLATGQVAAGALLMLPVVLLTETPWTSSMPSMHAIAALIALALLSTSLAYLLYFRLLESVGASNSLVITFLIPVVAIALGTLFLGEQMSTSQIGGMGLIMLGLAALDGRLLRR